MNNDDNVVDVEEEESCILGVGDEDEEYKKEVGVVGSLGQEEGIDPVSAQGSHSPPRPLLLLLYNELEYNTHTYKYT